MNTVEGFQLVAGRCLPYAVVVSGSFALLYVLIAAAADATEPLEQPVSEPDASYVLVWSDEFQQDGPPDPQKWAYEKGFVRNGELQWYQPKNATCNGGLLVIEARRERFPNPEFDADSKEPARRRRSVEYTSACVTTRGLHSWTFGRIEVRARIDAREGFWPAIWTVGDNGPWPESGEVDLMEYYGGNLLANACWSSGVRWRPVWDAVKTPLQELGGAEWAAEFHTWRMDWDKERIDLFVDDRLLNRIELRKASRGERQVNPFHQPQHLLLNLAVGGAHGGDPSKSVFPSRFEVDYVRVYEQTKRR